MKVTRKHGERAKAQQRLMRRDPVTLQDWIKRCTAARRLGNEKEAKQAAERADELRRILREDRARR